MAEEASASGGMEALGSGISGTAQGIATAMAAKTAAKATRYSAKKSAKEQKRKTLADLLNEALRREFEAGENTSNRQQKYRGDQAQVMQNLASQYVQALR